MVSLLKNPTVQLVIILAVVAYITGNITGHLGISIIGHTF